MVEMIVDFDKLRQTVHKVCVCTIPHTRAEERLNICPCEKFLETGKCKCGVFKEVSK